MAKNKDRLMLDKETIMKAIEQSQAIKSRYPEFWEFYEMLLELNEGLIYLGSLEKEGKK